MAKAVAGVTSLGSGQGQSGGGQQKEQQEARAAAEAEAVGAAAGDGSDHRGFRQGYSTGKNTSSTKSSSGGQGSGGSSGGGGGGGSPTWLSFTVMFLGALQFVLRRGMTELSTFIFFLSLILFILSGYALAEKAERKRWSILLPMILFAVWFFYFNASIQPNFLIVFLSICGVILLLPGILSKGESAKPELLGFLPVLFLFLDIGLLPFLVEKLGLTLTPLMEGLILWMPWWVFLGLLTLSAEPTHSSFMNGLLGLLKIGGVLYLLFVLLAPAIPDLGTVSNVLPGAGELEEAQLRLRQQLPQKESPFISNLACLFSGQTADMQQCVQDRQDLSEVEHLCSEIRGNEQGTQKYHSCVEEELEKKKNPAARVGGTHDPRIKLPTSAQITIDPKALPSQYGEQLLFPFELRVVNPREQQITVEVGCHFVQKGGNRDIAGSIKGQNPVTFKETPFITTYLCSPTTPLPPGRYMFMAEATLKNLQTMSRLQRAFIGDKPPQEKERLQREEISQVISIPVSQAPADLAKLNFDIGHALGEVIVENKPYRQVVVRSNIEAQGQGQLLRVQEYTIDLAGFQTDGDACLSDSRTCCWQGSLGDVTRYQGKIPLPSCLISSMPPEFSDPEDWLPYEFVGYIIYDFQVTAKQEIQLINVSEVPLS